VGDGHWVSELDRGLRLRHRRELLKALRAGAAEVQELGRMHLRHAEEYMAFERRIAAVAWPAADRILPGRR
jgi:hypothetical protein